jgi:hypothetical protein
VSFDVVDGAQGSQATNVRGINGGPLLCDHIPVRKVASSTPVPRGGGHAPGWMEATPTPAPAPAPAPVGSGSGSGSGSRAMRKSAPNPLVAREETPM